MASQLPRLSRMFRRSYVDQRSNNTLTDARSQGCNAYNGRRRRKERTAVLVFDPLLARPNYAETFTRDAMGFKGRWEWAMISAFSPVYFRNLSQCVMVTGFCHLIWTENLFNGMMVDKPSLMSCRAVWWKRMGRIQSAICATVACSKTERICKWAIHNLL